MKTNRVRLDPSEHQQHQLQVLGDRVSALWNAANYRCRQHFLSGDKVPSYPTLYRAFRDHQTYRALPSDMAQETLKKVREAWSSYFELRKRWKAGQLNHQPGLPRYRKDRQTGARPTDYIPITCGRSYRVNGRTIEVTMPKDVCQGRIVLSYRGLKRYVSDKMRRAELLYDSLRNRWYFNWSVRMPAPVARAGRVAGIDLGVRVLASVSIEGVSQSLHFAGRDVLKEWQYWTRQMARHQQELAHRNQKSSRRLSRYFAMRKARMRHAWDAMAKAIAQHCRRLGVGEVLIGWPKGILDEVKSSPKWNGILHGFWSFDQVSERIELALNRVGIKAERVGERGTSSHCCACGSANITRIPRSVIRCKDCHTTLHSDQVGSRNMIRQKYPVHWDGLEASPALETRWWTKHQWIDVQNLSVPAESRVAA